MQYNSSSNLVSDGNDSVMEATQSSLVLGGTDSSEDCTLLYNLLPYMFLYSFGKTFSDYGVWISVYHWRIICGCWGRSDFRS